MIAVLVVLVVLFSRKANGFYTQFEERFISNFNLRQAQNSFRIPKGMEDDFNMERLRMTVYSPLSGKTLAEGRLRERYGVNVVTIERADQIDMLNRQVDFFKGTDIFDIDRFKEQVLGNNESICDVFDEHIAHFEEANDVELPKTFAISKEVVKKGAPKFKSVLKLDKNFHVYIHGNRDLIERSFDKEKRMHYYKIYFENEE